MNFDIITDFFMWCSIINVSIIFISVIVFSLFSNFSYNNNKNLFSGNQIEFKKVIYTILLYYKVIVIVFNIVPFLVLTIFKFIY